MTMQTPDELRALAKIGGIAVIQIPVKSAAMLADAVEIADESSIALLVSELSSAKLKEIGARPYWDLDSCEPSAREAVDQAVRYLEARVRLYRHPDNQQWVSPKAAE